MPLPFAAGLMYKLRATNEQTDWLQFALMIALWLYVDINANDDFEALMATPCEYALMQLPRVASGPFAAVFNNPVFQKTLKGEAIVLRE
jgi:hypothetical protein